MAFLVVLLKNPMILCISKAQAGRMLEKIRPVWNCRENCKTSNWSRESLFGLNIDIYLVRFNHRGSFLVSS